MKVLSPKKQKFQVHVDSLNYQISMWFQFFLFLMISEYIHFFFLFVNSSDILHSSWSALQDSDDLSDDSSGGEPFFAMGLDLVNALEAK